MADSAHDDDIGGSLYDYHTAEYLREATPDEVIASRDEATGVILLDADGSILRENDARASHARSVYVIED